MTATRMRLATFATAFVTVATAAVQQCPVSMGGRPPGLLDCATAMPSAIATVKGLKETLAGTVYASDSSFRVNVGLAGVDSSAVVPVKDARICTRILRAIDSVTAKPPSTTMAVFIVRAGPRYIAIPNYDSWLSTSMWLLDTNFVFLGVTMK